MQGSKWGEGLRERASGVVQGAVADVSRTAQKKDAS